ncbi:MAG: class I SAM-dependent methyltransferase [Rhodospirillales bacterium]|nr:class I SAM-dependent methyltransferase [Rhodospirillales bacterium]
MSDQATALPSARRREGAHLARRLLALLLARIETGTLSVVLPDGSTLRAAGSAAGPEAVWVLHRWRALWRLLLGGDNGFAASFIDADWSSPDLVALLELAARNMDHIPAAFGPRPVRLFHRLAHLVRSNTRAGSRRNIVAHYDLGNAFYELWLDAGMNYSSALYRHPDMSLEAAQAAKHALVLDMLAVRPGDRVLEIGCGWGELAARLADAGAEVTGITLSPAQLAHARARLAGRARLLLQDYRDSEGCFDRIVSIEMIEAVGEAYWDAYFATLRKRLAPGGVVVIQAITIADPWLASYRQGADFIQRFIFPGGMLPSPGEIARLAAAHGFAITRQQGFGASYALTLAAWRARFDAAWPQIAALGFPPHFRRLWDYYLAYCEAGFRTGRIDVGLWQLQPAPC